MASDSLNQIGKYIRKTGKDADRAVKRAYPIQPRLERVRDVFDSTTGFDMQFEIDNKDTKVLLDLNFTLPPPTRGCKAGCIISQCEEFDFESGGNHSVTLDHSYLAKSISVFVNGERLPDYQVNELSPGAGEVFYQGTSGPDKVAICYVYSNCPEEGAFPNCPALTSVLGLEAILFSDRFDRIPGPVPYGGYGYWYLKDTLVADLNTPRTLKHAGGMTLFATPITSTTDSGSLSYVFEDVRGNGRLFETILAVDFTSLFSTFTYDITGAGLSISVNGQVQLFSTYEFQLASSASVSYGSISSTAQSPIDIKQRIFIRYLHDGTTYKVRMWPMNEPEPDYWIEHTPKLPNPLPAGTERANIAYSDHIGGTLSGTNGYLIAIQHWGGNVNGDSVWNYGGEIGNSWSRGVCYSKADLGLADADTYFGVCAETSKTLTEFSTYVNADVIVSALSPSNVTMRDIEPTFQLKYTWNQFLPDQAYYYGLDQTVISFMYDYGKGLNAKISGEVRWFVSGSTEFVPDTIATALMGFGYSEGTPSTGADYLAGNSINVVHSVSNEWVPFTFDVPVVEGHIQWGARIVDEPSSLASELGAHTGSLFLPRTAEIKLDFRRLKIESTMAPLGNSVPFCPDFGTLGSRCQAISDNFVGATLDYSCTPSIDTTFNALSGQVWAVNRRTNTRIEFNNSFKALFKANGITTDGSDGKCAWTSGIFSGAVSRSGGLATLTTEGPPSCGESSITFKFRYGVVGSSWPVGSVAPGWEDALGATIDPQGTISVGSLGHSYLTIHTSPSPSLNTIVYDTNTRTTTNNLLANVWYSVRIELTNTYRAKIWRTDTSEPSTWNVEAARTSRQLQKFIVSMAYLDYKDDNFYTEVSELQVTSIEPRIEGPNV